MITGFKKNTFFFICILPLIYWWCLSHEFYRHDNKSTSRRERVMCCYSIFEQSPAPKTKVQWRRRMQHAIFFSLKKKPLKQGKLVRVPLLISIGLAPLLILSNPSFAMARARTVAQVVPSPASSLVLFATSWTSLAPMFWYLSCRSMALATVTPSFVILGLPQLCSIMTFLPCKLEIYQICAFFVNVYHLWIHARI